VSCASFKPQAPDPTENAQSVGSVITFGKFRVVQLGDLTWNKEFELMCPNNPIGVADLMVASHHGLPISNSEALVPAVRPRVIIVNNAIRKGASPEAMKTYFLSPGVEDVWQSHFSLFGGQEYTVPWIFIANGIDQPMSTIPVEPMAPAVPGANLPPPPTHNGPAYWIKVSAKSDGTFTVINQRNGFAKTYTGPGRGTN
jgi:competence protein ComEC